MFDVLSSIYPMKLAAQHEERVLKLRRVGNMTAAEASALLADWYFDDLYEAICMDWDWRTQPCAPGLFVWAKRACPELWTSEVTLDG